MRRTPARRGKCSRRPEEKDEHGHDLLATLDDVRLVEARDVDCHSSVSHAGWCRWFGRHGYSSSPGARIVVAVFDWRYGRQHLMLATPLRPLCSRVRGLPAAKTHPSAISLVWCATNRDPRVHLTTVSTRKLADPQRPDSSTPAEQVAFKRILEVLHGDRAGDRPNHEPPDRKASLFEDVRSGFWHTLEHLISRSLEGPLDEFLHPVRESSKVVDDLLAPLSRSFVVDVQLVGEIRQQTLGRTWLLTSSSCGPPIWVEASGYRARWWHGHRFGHDRALIRTARE